MNPDLGMVIVQDTREQRPFIFECNTVVRKLAVGDYSLLNFENRITIERKSVGDLFATLGKGRDRFIREVTAMSKFEFKAIVIEGDFDDIKAGYHFSQTHPNSVIGSLLTFSIRYGLHVFFCGNYENARRITLELLKKIYHERRGNNYAP